ncbi:MAG: hypothetical protein AB7I18_10255 [Candidatus Berkiella sp.]
MSNTNQRFVQDINRLITVRNERHSELPKVSFEPVTAVRGIGDANIPPNTQVGSLASPLREIPGTRLYHEPHIIKSSDGLFALEKQTIRQAHFEDANGEMIVLEFQPSDF